MDSSEIIGLLNDPISQIYRRITLELSLEGPFDQITEEKAEALMKLSIKKMLGNINVAKLAFNSERFDKYSQNILISMQEISLSDFMKFWSALNFGCPKQYRIKLCKFNVEK